MKAHSYAQAGVSLEAGEDTVKRLKASVASTHSEHVLAGIGAFGGLFALKDLPQNPVLVASTDGVGTKLLLSLSLSSYESIGQDIVNHCVNDIACSGAGLRPLFFLDYIASASLEPEIIAEIVTGMAAACKHIDCAILGGETAEMPGVYRENTLDVVGTMVGLIDGSERYPRANIKAGDILLALPSSGVHTNGFSLIRQIFSKQDYDRDLPVIGNLGAALVEPHRCYLPEIKQLEKQALSIKAIAHITGGGLPGNVGRSLPEGLSVSIKQDAWQIPPLFEHIARQGNIGQDEMFRVFNMGIGMVLILAEDVADKARNILHDSFVIGQVIEGDRLEWH